MARPNCARDRARARARKMLWDSPNYPPNFPRRNARLPAHVEAALRGVIDPMFVGFTPGTKVPGAALAGALAAAAAGGFIL